MKGDEAMPEIEWRTAKALVPYARNARTHTPEQVSQIAESIRTFKWTNPILIDEEDGIVAGHGRVLGADIIYRAGETIQWVSGGALPKNKVPVIVARGWTEEQKRAYVIADNKLALNAGWDNDLLKLELGELKALGFDLTPIGFSVPELDTIMAGWDFGADPRERDGEHLKGISSVVSFHVPMQKADEAKEACRHALDEAGIEFEE